MPDTHAVPAGAASPDEVIAGLRAVNAQLADRLAQRDAQIAALAGELEEQRALTVTLTAQVAELTARVKQNSKNSSKPPSSDGLNKPAPKSLRKNGARKPGRPKGQPGATMMLTDHPDEVVAHRPAACGGCGHHLGGAEQTGMERRQVTELPEVKAVVTEHQLIGLACPGCGVKTKADAPEGVNAPVQYGPRASALAVYLWHGQFLSRDRAAAALADMFGCAPSPGAIAAMAARIAGFISPAISVIVKGLLACEAAHFDETGFRAADKLAWVHSASAGKHVLVTVRPRRGTEGMDAAGVLPSFTGIAVHDAWAPYDTYTSVAAHSLCGAHLLRVLTAVTETGARLDQAWAQQAISALTALNKAVTTARHNRSDAIGADCVLSRLRCFTDAAQAGILLNSARHSPLQKKRHALATRMLHRADDCLRFARDLRVPADNNEAERAIRMSKLRIKVSGSIAVNERRRNLLHHPLLPRHRQPPQHRLARRAHPRRPGQRLDPRNRLTLPVSTSGCNLLWFSRVRAAAAPWLAGS